MESSTRSVEIREADTIWHEEGGWFDARWHFSFDRYRDPEQMGVGALRVFNDDRIVAGAEWPLHPHQDIESLTYVVEGALPARRLARQQRPSRARRRAGDDVLPSRRPALGEERLGRRAHAVHPVLDPAEHPRASRPASSSASTRSRTEPIAGSRSWVRPGRMGSTWPRTPGRSSRTSPTRDG